LQAALKDLKETREMSGPLDLLDPPDPPDLRGLLVFREFRGRTFQFSSIQ
jgi:hypothetical protein